LFHGKPFRFECIFDVTLDGYPDHYFLSPVSAEALQLEREAFDIACGHGPCPELPSVLPAPIPRFHEAKDRYEAIQHQLLNDRNVRARATYRAVPLFLRRTHADWNGRQLWAVIWNHVVELGSPPNRSDQETRIAHPTGQLSDAVSGS
jgi:hypothetical protein